MLGTLQVESYTREVTPIERLFSRSPSATVGVIARIKGDISEQMLHRAIAQIQQRHPILRTRIQDNQERLWFTSDGAGTIPVTVVSRESDDHWTQTYQQACQIPYEFDVRPPIRLILVQSRSRSELMILCHHIICDGLSLAYLVRDLMVAMGHPNQTLACLPEAAPMSRKTIPQDLSLNRILRFLIRRINRKWARQKIYFDQEDYKDLNRAYWLNFRHRMLTIELNETQTAKLVARCRQERVTVNTALTTAFVGAQASVQARQPCQSNIDIAANLRDCLTVPIGNVMGYYAGLVTLTCQYNRKKAFWNNARHFHRKIKARMTLKNLFHELLVWCDLDPTILEALNFKMLGGLVPTGFKRYKKLAAFSKRVDVVSSLLKRNKMDALDQVLIGLVVTNLTRMDFPRHYGPLELERLFMNPGSAFPLATVNLVLGAVTCAGRLSLVMEYAEEVVATETVEKIKATAMKLLLNQ